MQKRNLVIVGVIFLAIIIALFVFLQTSPNSSGKSLNNLFALKKNIQCTFSDKNQSGTMYISNLEARGDFKSSGSDATIWHMVLKGNNISFWVDGSDTGFNMTTDSSNTNGLQNNFDVNKKYNFNCQDWTVDESKFNIPRNVNFQTSGQVLTPLTSPDPRLSPDPAACDACKTAPAQNQAACKAALGCK
jgi:hypothetical protein